MADSGGGSGGAGTPLDKVTAFARAEVDKLRAVATLPSGEHARIFARFDALVEEVGANDDYEDDVAALRGALRSAVQRKAVAPTKSGEAEVERAAAESHAERYATQEWVSRPADLTYRWAGLAASVADAVRAGPGTHVTEDDVRAICEAGTRGASAFRLRRQFADAADADDVEGVRKMRRGLQAALDVACGVEPGTQLPADAYTFAPDAHTPAARPNHRLVLVGTHERACDIVVGADRPDDDLISSVAAALYFLPTKPFIAVVIDLGGRGGVRCTSLTEWTRGRRLEATTQHVAEADGTLHLATAVVNLDTTGHFEVGPLRACWRLTRQRGPGYDITPVSRR